MTYVFSLVPGRLCVCVVMRGPKPAVGPRQSSGQSLWTPLACLTPAWPVLSWPDLPWPVLASSHSCSVLWKLPMFSPPQLVCCHYSSVPTFYNISYLLSSESPCVLAYLTRIHWTRLCLFLPAAVATVTQWFVKNRLSYVKWIWSQGRMDVCQGRLPRGGSS